MQLIQPLVSSTLGIDILWQSSLLSSQEENHPSWNGFMQEHFHGHNPASEIFIFPIINISASDENCIYSTFLFIIDQVQALHIDSPCVTFDQPLWINALRWLFA